MFWVLYSAPIHRNPEFISLTHEQSYVAYLFIISPGESRGRFQSKAFMLFLYGVGAFLSTFKHTYSAYEVMPLSSMLVIITVTETTSDAVVTFFGRDC